MAKTEAWVLYRGDEQRNALDDGTFRKGTIDLPPMGDFDLLVEPLYCSWEGNMSHALERDPIDICKQRNEEKVVLGNTTTLRILKKGSKVPDGYREGNIGLSYPGDQFSDRYGYPALAFGYDAPGTIGALARQNVIHHERFLHLPDNNFSLLQWAAFSLKYPTAYSNWRVARGAYRLQVTEEQNPSISVFAWGGGTTLAEMELAQIEKHKTYMLTSHPERMAYLQSRNITPVDRSELSDLQYESSQEKTEVRRYIKAFSKFRKLVRNETDGAGVDIFVDYINAYPLSTRRVVNREGVITTAGWKRINDYMVNRPTECIRRHIHVHTHCANYKDVMESIHFGIQHNWMPSVSEKDVWEWNDIHELARNHIDGKLSSFFSLCKVNAP